MLRAILLAMLHRVSGPLVGCRVDAMASLYNVRSVVICLIAFAAFLRFNEPAKLVRSDVEIKSDILRSNLVKLISTGMVLTLL